VYTLRLLEPSDAAALLEYHVRNRDHLKPWTPIVPDGFFELNYQQRRIDHYIDLYKRSEEFRFVVLDGKRFCASINMTAVEYNAFQNGRLGYSVDGEYTGKGIATEFIGKVCRYAFTQLGLHRLEANVMPRNVASQKVLRKCGFERIGYSPRMIEIAGRWEDHEMFARTLS
jgi:ribosomal-protein-alanine N-acetyltransferase